MRGAPETAGLGEANRVKLTRSAKAGRRGERLSLHMLYLSYEDSECPFHGTRQLRESLRSQTSGLVDPYRGRFRSTLRAGLAEPLLEGLSQVPKEVAASDRLDRS